MGEGLFLLVLLAAFFFLVVPIIAIVAAVRASSLDKRLSAAERKLAALEVGAPISSAAQTPATEGPALDTEPDDTPERPAISDAAPASSPEPEPAPVREPEPATLEPSRPATTSTPPPKTRVDWERRIAANWMVWAGGLALALGGLFLVRVAIDAGWFGPTARTVLAGLLGAGLVAASFRARSLDVVRRAQTSVKHLPAILAGTSVITLFGATLAAGVLYALLPPPVIFALFALIAALAVALAWIYGPALAALGLVGAYIGPFFTGADGGSPLMLLPYAFAVTAGGLGMIRVRGWPFVSWLTLAGAMLWGLLAFTDASIHTQWAIPVYALALAALSALFGQDQAETEFSWPKTGDGSADYRAILRARLRVWLSLTCSGSERARFFSFTLLIRGSTPSPCRC